MHKGEKLWYLFHKVGLFYHGLGLLVFIRKTCKCEWDVVP